MKSKKFGLSIKAKLLSIALLPPILLAAVLTLMASSSIQDGMKEEAFKGLRGVAYSLRELYDSTDSGDYTCDSAGNVKKGNLEVSGHYTIEDSIKKNTDYDVTLFYGDTRVATSLVDKDTKDRLVGTKASDVVIDEVLKKGNEYSDDSITINGLPYYGYYVPIEQNGEIIGMAFSGIQSSEVNEFIAEKTTAVLTVSVIILICLIIIGILFSFSLSKAVKKAELIINELGEGNLAISVDKKFLTRSDELGAMARQIQVLIDKLVTVIGNVKNTSTTLFKSGTALEDMATQSSNTTDEISRAVEGVSSGASSQAEETENASVNIEHMGNLMSEIVDSVESLTVVAGDMKLASDDSSHIINELSVSNDRTTDAISKISQQVLATNNSVQDIRKAIEIITSIAEETNLLSLNASIEAARAGEHGRGFAVVAGQIQKLAEESNNSAAEITRIIDTLLTESETTVMVMDEVNVIVNKQREKLEETKDKFNLVVEGVNLTTKETDNIQSKTSICDSAREKIIDVISNLSAISEENAASSQETTASMEELNSMLSLLADASKDLLSVATELEENMQFFKL